MKNKKKRTFRDLLKNPWHFIAFGFGSGLLPWGPGTWGTLAAIPFYYGLQAFSLITYGLILSIAFFVGILICGITAYDLGVSDHPGIVWDEMVGFCLTMMALPASIGWIVSGFFFVSFV